MQRALRQGIVVKLGIGGGVLGDDQRAEIVDWLRDQANIAVAANEIVATGKTLDYYIGCWGMPQEKAALESGAPVSVWRGEGYLFLIVDYDDFRAAAVY